MNDIYTGLIPLKFNNFNLELFFFKVSFLDTLELLLLKSVVFRHSRIIFIKKLDTIELFLLI